MHTLQIDSDVASEEEEDDDHSADQIRRRSTINLGNQRQRNLRRFRLKVYNFLEKPLHAASAPYHFLIFGLIISNLILGAATGHNDETVKGVHFVLEVTMVLFFIIEFIIRLWSVKADAKYRSKWGRIYYLFHTVTIIDFCIIPATIMLLLSHGGNVDGRTLETLRFIQILRLFHVDRQMATWKLLKRMIMLSKWQLLAAYYITLVLGILMATIIYSTEAYSQNITDVGYRLELPNGTTPIFPTMAHSWWFTAVTVLTIGYGDIVPHGALTKIVVCILGFIAFCTFQAASTQISVGMTLMMEEENKKQCTARLRNIAASTIQCWWRYHLATHWRSHRRYIYFTHVCYKLYVTEERLNQNRELARKIKEKLERKKPQKKKSIVHQNSVTAELLKVGIKGAVKPVLQKENSVERKKSFRRTKSEERAEVIALPDPSIRKRVLFAESRTQSAESSFSSSCDVTELETQLEVKNLLDGPIEMLSAKEVDITLLMKYRPLLRFFNFVMFRFLMKKFRIQRKAGELLAIEAEIAERENSRNLRMKELESAIIALIGKPTFSPFSNTGEKASLIDRVMLCEEKMAEIENKVEKLNEITIRCISLLEKSKTGLPPKPRQIKRQETILENFEDPEEDFT